MNTASHNIFKSLYPYMDNEEIFRYDEDFVI